MRYGRSGINYSKVVGAHPSIANQLTNNSRCMMMMMMGDDMGDQISRTADAAADFQSGCDSLL